MATNLILSSHEQESMHQLMAHTLNTIITEISTIQNDARAGRTKGLPAWPMIILRTPKGWTGPKVVDGKPVEDTWRAHQVQKCRVGPRSLNRHVYAFGVEVGEL